MTDLRVDSKLNSTGFNQGVDSMGRKVGKFKDQLKGLAGTIGVTFGIGAMVAFGRKITKFGSDLSDLAIQSGMSIENFQVMELALLKAGVSTEKIRSVMSKLNMAMGQANRGIKTYTDLFDLVGISQEKLSRSSPEEVFEMIAKSMANAKRGSAEFGAAIEILGARSAPQLTEVMQEISEKGFAKMREEALATGQILDKETIQKLDEAEDSFQEFGRTIMVVAAPAVVKFTEGLQLMGAMLKETPNTLGAPTKGLKELFSIVPNALRGKKTDMGRPLRELGEAAERISKAGDEFETAKDKIDAAGPLIDDGDIVAANEAAKITDIIDSMKEIVKLREKMAETKEGIRIGKQDPAARLEEIDREIARRRRKQPGLKEAGETVKVNRLEAEILELQTQRLKVVEKIREEQEKTTQEAAKEREELSKELDMLTKKAHQAIKDGQERLDSAKKTLNIEQVAVDRLARIGGFIGGQSNPAARAAQKQVELQKMTNDILGDINETLEDIAEQEKKAVYG